MGDWDPISPSNSYVAPTPTGLPLSQTSSWLSPQNTIIPGATVPTAQTLNSPLASANQWMNALNAYVVPGADPSLGVLPGGQAINLTSGAPYTGTIDPTSQAFMNIAQGGQFPTFGTILANQGGKGSPLSGRGYQFTGMPSSQETALQNAFLGGDLSVGPQLAHLRQSRIQANQPSMMQSIMKKYVGPAIMMAPSAFLGPAYGAAWGTLMSGAMNKWKNPGAIALGGLGGLAGGYGGSQLAGAMGLNPFAAGAVSGAGSSIGSQLGQTIGGVPFAGQNFLKNVAIGTAAGGVGSSLKSLNTPPGTEPSLGSKMLGSLGSSATGAILGSTIPGEEPKKKYNPYAQGKKAL